MTTLKMDVPPEPENDAADAVTITKGQLNGMEATALQLLRRMDMLEERVTTLERQQANALKLIEALEQDIISLGAPRPQVPDGGMPAGAF